MRKHQRTVTSGPISYVGPGFLNGIPATDLDADDLARLASRHGTSVEELRERLLASGNYQSPPAEPAAVAEASTDE